MLPPLAISIHNYRFNRQPRNGDCLPNARLGLSLLGVSLKGLEHLHRVLADRDGGSLGVHLARLDELHVSQGSRGSDVGDEDVTLVGRDVRLAVHERGDQRVHLVLPLLVPHHQIAVRLAAQRLVGRPDERLHHHCRSRLQVNRGDLDLQGRLFVGVGIGGEFRNLVADREVSELTQTSGLVGEADLVEARRHDVDAHVVHRVHLELQGSRAVLLLNQLEVRAGAQQIDLLRHTPVANHHGREGHDHILAERLAGEEHRDSIRIDLTDGVGEQLDQQLLRGDLLLAERDRRNRQLQRARLDRVEKRLLEHLHFFRFETQDVVVDVVASLMAEEREVDEQEVEHLERNLQRVSADRSARARDGRKTRALQTSEKDVTDLLDTRLDRRGHILTLEHRIEVARPVELVDALEEELAGVQDAAVLPVTALLEAVRVDAQHVEDLSQFLVEQLDRLLNDRHRRSTGIALAQFGDHLGKCLLVAVLQLDQLVGQAGDSRLELGRHARGSPGAQSRHASETGVIETLELTLGHEALHTVGGIEQNLARFERLLGLTLRKHRNDAAAGQAGEQAGGGRVGSDFARGLLLLASLLALLLFLVRTLEGVADEGGVVRELEVLIALTFDHYLGVVSGVGLGDGGKALADDQIDFAGTSHSICPLGLLAQHEKALHMSVSRLCRVTQIAQIDGVPIRRVIPIQIQTRSKPRTNPKARPEHEAGNFGGVR